MCRRAKVFEEDREDMMGHYSGLQKHYERYVEEDFERFSEYEKAIPYLTISDEERAKEELKIQQKENEILVEKQKEIDEMKVKLQLHEDILLKAVVNQKK